MDLHCHDVPFHSVVFILEESHLSVIERERDLCLFWSILWITNVLRCTDLQVCPITHLGEELNCSAFNKYLDKVKL